MTFKNQFLAKYTITVNITCSAEFGSGMKVWFIVAYRSYRCSIPTNNHKPTNPRSKLVRKLSFTISRPQVHSTTNCLFYPVIEIIPI